jgi:hypothetical protein
MSICFSSIENKSGSTYTNKSNTIHKWNVRDYLVEMDSKIYPEFLLKQPQGLEMKRPKVLCPENVESLYKNLSNLYDQNKYEPHQI